MSINQGNQYKFKLKVSSGNNINDRSEAMFHSVSDGLSLLAILGYLTASFLEKLRHTTVAIILTQHISLAAKGFHMPHISCSNILQHSAHEDETLKRQQLFSNTSP